MTHFFTEGGVGDGGNRPTARSLSDPSTFPLSIRLGVVNSLKIPYTQGPMPYFAT